MRDLFRHLDRNARARCATVLVVALGLGVAGCLGEPEIEDRWTRLDIGHVNLSSGQSLQAGVAESISVSASITYRRLLTGFAVAELRASSTISPGSVSLHPDAPRVAMAQDIDRILAGSVSVGRAVRAVTGWDHLIQPLQLTFNATPSATVDSAGVTVGSTTGLFLVCYLGSGVEIELPGGRDSVIVTPFNSTAYEILPVGMELQVVP